MAAASPRPADPSGAPESIDRLLTRLEWTVLRRLDGLLQGDFKTLWRGAGLDLADLRGYQFGDEVRHIDWSATARLQTTMVRQFTEDRALTAWFLVDLSGSVEVGSAQRSKRDQAEGLVAALASLLNRHGNRVGMLVYQPGSAAQDALLTPASGRAQVLRLMARLRQPRPRQPSPTPASRSAARGETQLADLLGPAERLLRRRSMVFVLSDFISAPGWAVPLGRLAQRHEVLAVRLFDPLEQALPDLGWLIVEDAETGEQCTVDSQDPGFRERYAALAAAQETQLRGQFTAAGVDVLELATTDDLLAALQRLVALRRQRARASVNRRAGRRPAPLSHTPSPASTPARTQSPP